jgi:hypothetical protein
MRNLMIALLALLGGLTAVEYNQYSHCKEWRLELGLRGQGIMPERSWSGAAVDFVAGDLITVGKKWQCGIQIERSEAVWSAIEAVAIVPAAGSAALWVARTAGRGLSRMAVLLREATGLRSAAGILRGPVALVGEITASRAAILFAGGLLLAIYFGSGQLLLDAMALLPWIVQLAFWTILFFGLGKCAGLAARAAILLVRGLRRCWRPAIAAPLTVQS